MVILFWFFVLIQLKNVLLCPQLVFPKSFYKVPVFWTPKISASFSLTCINFDLLYSHVIWYTCTITCFSLVILQDKDDSYPAVCARPGCHGDSCAGGRAPRHANQAREAGPHHGRPPQRALWPRGYPGSVPSSVHIFI